MPESKPGTIRASCIRCDSRPPTVSPRFIPGRSIRMASTTACSAITPKGRFRCSFTAAAKTFMGVWNPHTNTGTVHFAEYEELPAKKIWSWGVDADGLDWRKALSDNNSAYLEVQAGLFRNQETYAFLEPRQVIHFSEYWMPVREIGGISRANLAGVASLVAQGEQPWSSDSTRTRPFPQASVSISKGSRAVFHEKVDLTPEHAWTHEIPNADAQTKYTIEIQDAQGRNAAAPD